jgi:hypothetical protein
MADSLTALLLCISVILRFVSDIHWNIWAVNMTTGPHSPIFWPGLTLGSGRTSTAEPTPPPGISWIYLKDMTEYLYFWKSPQKIIFDLGNLISE